MRQWRQASSCAMSVVRAKNVGASGSPASFIRHPCLVARSLLWHGGASHFLVSIAPILCVRHWQTPFLCKNIRRFCVSLYFDRVIVAGVPGHGLNCVKLECKGVHENHFLQRTNTILNVIDEIAAAEAANCPNRRSHA